MSINSKNIDIIDTTAQHTMAGSIRYFKKGKANRAEISQIARIKGIYEANEIGDTMGADPAWWEVDIATGN